MTNTNLHINLDDNFTIINLVPNDEYNFNLEANELHLNIENNTIDDTIDDTIYTQFINQNTMNGNNIIKQQPICVNSIRNPNNNIKYPDTENNNNTIYYGFTNLMKLCFDI